MKLIANWRQKIWRLHTMRVAFGGALFWSGLSGLYLVWPAFADQIPIGFYALGGVAMSAAIGVARLLKQPGLE